MAAEWGVVNLSEDEQRQVRGGTAKPQTSRAANLRCALQCYIQDRRNGTNRQFARNQLLNNIVNNTCSCGS